MQKKIFDVVTAKKLIADYADKINNYMKENQNLKCQLEDMKMTLIINKELLFKYISTNVLQSEQLHLLNEYKNDNLRLLEKNEKLHNEKTFLDKRVYRTQQEAEDNVSRIREELEKFTDENFILKNRIIEKETIAIYLRKELEKIQLGPSSSVTVKEIVISEPNRVNVDLINELNYTRELIGKVSKLLNVEKNKNEKLQEKVKSLVNQGQINKKSKDEDLPQVANSMNISKTEIYLKNEDLFGGLIKQMTILENKNPDGNKEDGVLETISFLSDDEGLNTLGEEIESPSIKFPDKVNYSSNSGVGKKPTNGRSHSLVPKLDFKIIQSKYQSNVNKPTQPIKVPHLDEASKNLEKVKMELKVAQKSIQELKTRLEKYRKAYNDKKVELVKSKEDLIIAHNKCEVYENQIRKFMMPASTEDTASNKRAHSMTNNTGRSHEEL